MNPFAEGTFNICTGEYIKSGNGCREEAAKIWTVEYQPLKHPNTGNPDDAVNLLNKVFIGTTGTEPVLTVDETDLTTDATQSFAANFTSAFGNDSAGKTDGDRVLLRQSTRLDGESSASTMPSALPRWPGQRGRSRTTP